MTEQDLLLPLALLSVLGLATVAVVVVRRLIHAPDRLGLLKRLAASDALTLAIVIVAGYAALASSQNERATASASRSQPLRRRWRSSPCATFRGPSSQPSRSSR